MLIRHDGAAQLRVGAAVAQALALSPTTARVPPLLVKAAAGGGGKGMRIVPKALELRDGKWLTTSALGDAVASAAAEAAASFGSDALLLELYVERGRHIEVQVLADEHGNVVHLFERECRYLSSFFLLLCIL